MDKVRDCINWNSIYFYDFFIMDSGKVKFSNFKDVIIEVFFGV